MKQWEGPVRESAQDVAVFLCLCKYIYVPAYLRHSALKSNLSPNQNTCLYWRSRKPVCGLLQGSPSLQTTGPCARAVLAHSKLRPCTTETSAQEARTAHAAHWQPRARALRRRSAPAT